MTAVNISWRSLTILSFAVAGLAAFFGAMLISITPVTSTGKFFLPGILALSWGYAMHAIKTRRTSKDGLANTRDLLVVLTLALVFGLASVVLGGLFGATWTD